MQVKYPGVVVQLIGEDGNAFAIIGRVTRALRDGKVGGDERFAFIEEARSGDYDNVLQTCMKWVTVR